MIHENTAAAIMLGIDRHDVNETQNVLFYNMGGRDTEVSIVRYGNVVDDKGKNFEHIEILAEAWDETLGSTEVDRIIMRELAKRFNSLPERSGKTDVMTNNRAVKRL